MRISGPEDSDEDYEVTFSLPYQEVPGKKKGSKGKVSNMSHFYVNITDVNPDTKYKGNLGTMEETKVLH